MSSDGGNFWFFPIAAAALHGVLLAVVLWRKKENRRANRWFAALLLALSLHLGEYSLSVSGAILKTPHLMLTTYPLFFVIAPMYYLYARAYLQAPLGSAWQVALHFLPALLMLLLLTPFYALSAEEKLAFFSAMAGGGFREVPPEQFVIMYLQIGQLSIYLFMVNRLIGRRQAFYRARGNEAKIRWLKSATLAFLGFTFLFAVTTTVLALQRNYRVETDYTLVLLLAFLIYVVGYVALIQPELFRESLKNGRAQTLLTPGGAGSLKKKLLSFMEREKPYLQEDLKITDLAEALDTPVHHLSELLNNELRLSFFDFVNEYRIETAKSLLADPKRKDDKILAIAFDSGFGNKATFNRVFKQATGKTPGAFRREKLVTGQK